MTRASLRLYFKNRRKTELGNKGLAIHWYHLQQNTLYPQRGQILRREFLVLSRFMLCSRSRLAHIKDLPSTIGCEPIKNVSRIVFCKIYHLWGKGYFAAIELIHI